MGEIKTTVCKDRDLTILKVIGQIDSDDIKELALKEKDSEPTRYVIWDYSDGEATGLDPVRIIQRKDVIDQFGKGRNSGKSAFVFAREVDFGIGRMIETYLEHIDYTIAVKSFLSLEEAYDWLGIESPDSESG